MRMLLHTVMKDAVQFQEHAIGSYIFQKPGLHLDSPHSTTSVYSLQPNEHAYLRENIHMSLDNNGAPLDNNGAQSKSYEQRNIEAWFGLF
jgi:hypothetical protein